jgi:hypothetical protein
MTGALVIYSAVFMRYSLAVTPKNYLLFGCHFINECSQLSQGYRYLKFNYWGGREEAAAAAASQQATGALEGVKGAAKEAAGEVRDVVGKVAGK